MYNDFNLPKYHAVYVNLNGDQIYAAKNDDLSELIKEMETFKEAEGRPVLIIDEHGTYIKVRTRKGVWKNLVEIEIE